MYMRIRGTQAMMYWIVCAYMRYETASDDGAIFAGRKAKNGAKCTCQVAAQFATQKRDMGVGKEETNRQITMASSKYKCF